MEEASGDSRPTGHRGAVRFEERQRFRQGWIVALVVLIAAWAWIALFIRLTTEGADWSVWLSVLIAAVFGVGMPWFLWTCELRTTVGADALDVRFSPRIGGHRFAPGDIADVAALRYQPMREFGGWGVRWGRGGSRALNVSGDTGVEIHDRSGRRWVIGSQRPEELTRAISDLVAPRGGR